ncbi:MAG TPA: hypothetical protein V6C72_04705 [Chroococcales cyanobacterium]
MSFKTFVLQLSFFYAPFSHLPTESVTPILYRGSDPKMKEIQALHDKGVKSIISLRTNPEPKKAALCEKLGMHWYNIKTGVFKTPSDEQYDEFCSIVDNPANQPCFVSCELDMDRTSAYIAAYRLASQHWTVAQMTEELRNHHQKAWWPIFRKYRAKAIAYAERKKKQQEKTASGDAGQPPVREEKTASADNKQVQMQVQADLHTDKPSAPQAAQQD